MCLGLRPTHGGDDQPLVVMFGVADRRDVDVLAHGLLHCQGLKGDASVLVGPGEDRDFQQWEVKENTSCLYDQL